MAGDRGETAGVSGPPGASLASASLASASLASTSLASTSLADASLADASLASASPPDASLASASPPDASLASASLSLRLTRFRMRWVARPILARAKNVGVLRLMASMGAWFAFPPRDMVLSPWGEGGLELRPTKARTGPLVVWFHGGGYVACSPHTHRSMLIQIARASDLRLIAPAYRLAPEHPGGAAFADALRACQAILASGIPSGALILAGDSAGGGLAAAVTAALCGLGQPPGGLLALSPWTDMTGSGASHRENADRDVLLPPERLADLVGLVRGDLPPEDPRLSPAFASFPGLPRAYLSVGTDEILRDDTRLLAARLAEGGTEVTAHELHGALHVLAFQAPRVPEARAEIARIAAWLQGIPL